MGVALASASSGGVGMAGEYLAHASISTGIEMTNQVHLALRACEVAHEVFESAHVGAVVSESGEHAKHRKKEK
jgi:hypothetical protein